MLQPSSIEISRSALESNIDFIRSIIDQRVKISSVVKSNAYGHGIEIFVPLAEECGINHFSVFSAEEADRVLNKCSSSTDIMIMGNIDNEDLGWAIENSIEFFVFENSRLEAALETAKKMGKKAKIHLELETGMNRTGFEIKELKKAIAQLKRNREHFSLEGVCTHYAGAESIANYVRIQRQYKNFLRLKKALLKENFKPRRYHTACSAATITYPQTQMDMVRIGILQYGYWPSRETHIHYFNRHRVSNGVDPLHRIITWRSKIMNTKKVKTGEFVGYGTTYLAQNDMEIATVPVGYGHGFGRSLSNLGRVLLKGHRVGVVGMVNMNLMIIDITGLENVKKGDEVILIGKQGDVEISVASFSELSEQVNYETLTRLPLNIPRKVVD